MLPRLFGRSHLSRADVQEWDALVILSSSEASMSLAQHSISLTNLAVAGKEAYEPSARFSEVRTATLRSCVHSALKNLRVHESAC